MGLAQTDTGSKAQEKFWGSLLRKYGPTAAKLAGHAIKAYMGLAQTDTVAHSKFWGSLLKKYGPTAARLAGKAINLTWAWPRPAPVRRKSSGDPFSVNTDPPLLDLLAKPSKLTWAWPRPAPVAGRRRSSSFLLSQLPNWATLPTKCSALPKLPLPLPRRLSSGDHSTIMCVTIMAKLSLITRAWPRPAPLPWRRRSSSLLLSQLPNWATLPTKCSAFPRSLTLRKRITTWPCPRPLP